VKGGSHTKRNGEGKRTVARPEKRKEGSREDENFFDGGVWVYASRGWSRKSARCGPNVGSLSEGGGGLKRFFRVIPRKVGERKIEGGGGNGRRIPILSLTKKGG